MSTRTKQRIVRVVIHEVVVDLDDDTHEAVLTVHWIGGRHTELRVARVRNERSLSGHRPSAVEAVRKLGTKWSDRDIAITLNRMRCKEGRKG